MMKYAFQQSPAKSFRTFLEEGGRDPRKDPRPGDVVGVKTPEVHAVCTVEAIEGGRVDMVMERLHPGRSSLQRRARCTIEDWISGNAAAQVFSVAAETEDQE